jgi:hypothetical protein
MLFNTQLSTLNQPDICIEDWVLDVERWTLKIAAER